MSDDGPRDEKPAILQDSEFTLEEGTLYKVLRTTAIWMNKLFFSSLVLLAVWLLLGLTGQVEPGCADSIAVGNGTEDQPTTKCSVWLSTTATYLGAMAVFSFLLSIAAGLLGLVVGKDLVTMTRTEDEVGAPAQDGTDRPSDGASDDAVTGATEPDDEEPDR